MLGAWRVRAGGATPALPRARTGVAMATRRAGAVCRSAPVVELLDDASVRRHPVLRRARAGPVPARRRPGRGDRAASTSVDAATPVGAVLLDQRVAAGIGNVYRAEVLWACGVDPWTPVGDALRRGDAGRVRDRRPPAAGEPHDPRATSDRARGARRVRASRPSLPPLRDADPGRADRRPGALGMVVPLPARLEGDGHHRRRVPLGDRHATHARDRGRRRGVRTRRERDRRRPRGRHDARGRVPAHVRGRRRPLRPGPAARRRRDRRELERTGARRRRRRPRPRARRAATRCPCAARTP